MGGPFTRIHVFSNGLELGSGILILSPDGRYGVCDDVRDGVPLTLADLELGRVRRCMGTKVVRQIRSAGENLARVRYLLEAPDTLQYRQVHGLWVAPEQALPPDTLELANPAGGASLQLEREVDPAAWFASGAPLAALLAAEYRLCLEGELLPVRTRSPEEIVWSASGDLLLIPAEPVQGEAEGSHWLWRRQGGSSWVKPLVWEVADKLPAGSQRRVVEIDEAGYWIEVEMYRARDPGYPQRSLDLAFPSSYSPGSRPHTWVMGADERGRCRIEALHEENDSLRARLPWSGNQEGVLLESRPAVSDCGVMARFLPTSLPGRGLQAYRVEAGLARAEGVGLFHLWSDCGRYLALQPQVGPGKAADHFFVLDVQSGRRLKTDFRASGLQLLAWVAGELQVGGVVGCVPDIRFSFDPFAPVSPPPRPGPDGRLQKEWLLLESWRFRVDGASGQLVGPLPKSQELRLPPYPNAAFDFYYQAPAGGRSVFVFGARNGYQDAYPREESCRYQARAVTSDGICLEGLGVGMIWSPDGRYLVVTTRVPGEHPNYDDLVWTLRVVDCEARLMYPEVPLAYMPIFETSSAQGIGYLQVDVDWWRDDLETSPAYLSWSGLLAGEPEPLREEQGLWLPSENPWHPRWPETFASAWRR